MEPNFNSLSSQLYPFDGLNIFIIRSTIALLCKCEKGSLEPTIYKLTLLATCDDIMPRPF